MLKILFKKLKLWTLRKMNGNSSKMPLRKFGSLTSSTVEEIKVA